MRFLFALFFSDIGDDDFAGNIIFPVLFFVLLLLLVLETATNDIQTDCVSVSGVSIVSHKYIY